MPKVPGLFSRKGGGWTFRVRVPDHLRSELGKREIWKSLGSVDYHEAARLARIERVNADRLFVATEARLKAEQVEELTEAQLFHLVRSFFFGLEQESGDILADRSEREDLAERVHEDLVSASQGHDDSAIQQIAHSVLAKARVQLRPGAKSFHRLCALVQQALIEHYQREEDRLRNRPEQRLDRTFADLDRFHPPKQHLTLADAIKRYEEDPQRLSVAVKTKAAWKFRFGAWIDLIDADKAITEIARDELRAAVLTLMRLPANASKHFPDMPLRQAVSAGEKAKLPTLSPKSVQLYINCLNSLFRFLVQEELVTRNPVAGLKGPKVDDDENRRPWSIDELKAFFSAHPYERPWSASLAPSWLFWLPLLGLYSGARQGELAGLLGGDLV